MGRNKIGSIQKRGEDTYLLTVSAGKGLNGKRLRFPRTVHCKSDKEAEAELALFYAEVKSGDIREGSKMTFSAFAQKWLSEYAEVELELKTLHRYKQLLERVVPAIGHIKLGELKPLHFTMFYNNLRENGVRLDSKFVLKPGLNEAIKNSGISYFEFCEKASVNNRTLGRAKKFETVSKLTAEKICKALGMKINDLFIKMDDKKGLDEQTILHHHKLISGMLNKAVQWQLIKENPVEFVDSPKVEEREAKSYDDEQAYILVEALDKAPLKYRTLIILAVYSGLRESELTGLTWSNVDFEKKRIEVKQASSYIPGTGTFSKNTKTKKSKRIIYFPKHVMDLLSKYQLWQKECSLKVSDKWEESGMVFTQKFGKPMHTYTPAKWFNKFIRNNGFPPLNFHGLRHTSISILIRNGYDLIATSNFSGHSRPSTTTDIYGHTADNSNKGAVKILDKVLNKKKNVNKKRHA